MDYKKAQKIAVRGATSGVALVLAGSIIDLLTDFELAFCILHIVGILTVFVSIGIGHKHCKCPYCNGKLHLGINPRFCPHCGGKLREDAK